MRPVAGASFAVTERALHLLEGVATQREFLNTRGRRLSPVRVNLALRQLRRLANLKKPLTPHRLRHACAVHLLQGGANLRVIQKLLGHTHLDTTAIYLHLEREEVRRSLLLHHPREKLDLGE